MGKQGPEPAHIVAIHPLYTLKTDVIFSVRGREVRVRLDRRTANRFVKFNGVGTVGLLTWKRRRMVKWQPTGTPKRTPSKRKARARQIAAGSHTAFISYPSVAAADARWVADVLQAAGITVWMDEQGIEPGDSLPERITKAIKESDSFVPIVDQDYLNSRWCMKELEIAAEANVPVAPVKISFDELIVSPGLRDLYERKLGDPLMLDLRRADAEDRLLALADKLARSGHR